ncbi:MAG: hypothetical protein CL623_07500 [Arcobacter sp.]|nr:hypothetical protein [Arcobacter sp.]
MLKSIFLLITTVILFSGCHRYHHNVRTVVSPAIIFKPFHFKSKYHHNYRGHYNSYYKRGRGH